MKKQKINFLSLIVIVSIGVMGCNPLKKMIKNEEQLTFNVTPNPIELHGDSIEITIKGTFPPSYFHKLAMVTLAPVLQYPEESSIKTVKNLKEYTIMGEGIEEEGKKIEYAKGGSYTYVDKVPYTKEMKNAFLELRMVGKYKGKLKDFTSKKIADATITTPLLVQSDDKPINGKDKFQRVYSKSIYADMHFLINSSTVRPTELSASDIKDLKAFVKKGVSNNYDFKKIEISSYASPDGEQTLNTNLASDRANSATKYLQDELEKQKIAAGANESFYNKDPKGEDWIGFKELMQKSEVKDKELILRILGMYSDLDKREQEIKNIAATYLEIANKILPQLRRSQITLYADSVGRSDEELKQLSSSNPELLSKEEMLKGISLVSDMNEQLKLYEAYTRIFPDDWRGYNNIGYIYLMQNKLNEAQSQFFKVNSMTPNVLEVQNNMAIVHRWKGDRNKAKELLETASSAGSEVSYNLGIIDIMNGKYESAVSNFGSENTFNVALAKMLNGNTEGALQAIDASDDMNTAIGYYLKAIIGARTDNKDLLLNNLKSAITKDVTIKEKAKIDLEFIKYFQNEEFKALVQ